MTSPKPDVVLLCNGGIEIPGRCVPRVCMKFGKHIWVAEEGAFRVVLLVLYCPVEYIDRQGNAVEHGRIMVGEVAMKAAAIVVKKNIR